LIYYLHFNWLKLLEHLNDLKILNNLLNIAFCKLTFPVPSCLNQVLFSRFLDQIWFCINHLRTYPHLSPCRTECHGVCLAVSLSHSFWVWFSQPFLRFFGLSVRLSVRLSVSRCVEHVTSWSDVLAAKLAAITCNIGYTYLHIDAILDLVW